MKKKKLAGILLALLLLCGGCAEKKDIPKLSEIGFYLDTVITLTAYVEDGQILKDALEECGRYEQKLSRTIEGSDVWKINHAEGQPVEVSDDTVAILQCAGKISGMTGGAFDVTIAPVSTIWDFTSGKAELPDAEAIARAVELVDYTKITLNGNTVALPEGMMIDLGGIAKGYIADRIKEYLEKRGVKHAILSFGGNVVAIGDKPDGTAWKVGIQDIDGKTGDYMMVSRNSDGSSVTSGIYERGFDLDGVRYHHLLSTETGWPVQNELAAVTIFSKSSMEGDALSTAAFVLGTEEGLKLINSLDGIEALFISRDRAVTYSAGAEAYIIK
ncbi:MAG: FAD:protein FMN transferase [Clostridiales bacterium]|nr:FAD:protein FMN transferase [Clostridiales bacterium]